jgi:MYXO-CTERM domain-containing protein
VKRVATNRIAVVEPEQLMFSSEGDAGGHCDGDSGGPSLAVGAGREALVGVHSWGTLGCRGESWDARVDGELAWLREQTEGDVRVAPSAPHAPAGAAAPDASRAGGGGCGVGGAQAPRPAGALVALALALAAARRRGSSA